MALLSKAEQKVLTSLSTGKLYKEIGVELGISVNTVKKHLKNIYRKLDIHRRGDAIQYYFDKQAGASEVSQA